MRTTIPVSNSQDIINSRDIIERIRELKDCGILDGHDAREYAALTAVQKQCEGHIDEWKDGVQLISDEYFEQYAQDYAEGIFEGNMDNWPCGYIDWGQAANALQGDYICVDFDGIDYWIRP